MYQYFVQKTNPLLGLSLSLSFGLTSPHMVLLLAQGTGVNTMNILKWSLRSREHPLGAIALP
jgi:hypothetical protein